MIWIVFIILVSVYLTNDYIGAKTVNISSKRIFGFNCLFAKDLLVQEYDQDDNLWASRGMLIYRLEKNDDKFRKIARVPCGFSPYWLRNFTLIRKLTLRPECIEFTVAENGDICAFSSGHFWYNSHCENSFKRSMTVRNFGKGDQGLRNVGLTRSANKVMYFGEYFRNKNREPVNIYTSFTNGKSWDLAYTFPALEIRHIHGIQIDPFTNITYFLTGDLDSESKVGYTKDNFKSIQILGEGSQTWRICQLVFTEKSIIWGTDTSESSTSGFYIFDKASEIITKIGEVTGAIFFGTALKNGNIIFTSNREKNKLEKDNFTRLYIVNEISHKVKEIKIGTWKHNKPGFWYKYAQLRTQRYQGASSLALSILNQNEVSDNDLVIIDENAFSNFIN